MHTIRRFFCVCKAHTITHCHPMGHLKLKTTFKWNRLRTAIMIIRMDFRLSKQLNKYVMIRYAVHGSARAVPASCPGGRCLASTPRAPLCPWPKCTEHQTHNTWRITNARYMTQAHIKPHKKINMSKITKQWFICNSWCEPRKQNNNIEIWNQENTDSKNGWHGLRWIDKLAEMKINW